MSASPQSSVVPKHVAIIMDGNNRWAKQRHLPGSAGHKAGIERLRDVLESCRDRDINVLTVFAFSSENWQRPAKEVSALMSLFYHYITQEAKKLKQQGVRLRVIGRRDRFESKLVKAIDKAEALTVDGCRTLVIAADYGGRWDIVQAARMLGQQVLDGQLMPDQISEALLDQETALRDFPPVDLLIRTGGEYRISNFLLWQSAYAELFFSPSLWPDFNQIEFNAAIDDYAKRQRRFGLSGDQVEQHTIGDTNA